MSNSSLFNRREFLQGSGAFAAGTLLAPSIVRTESAAQSARLNILFILVDQWRATATGYGGDPNVRTPNLDRLAGEGLSFTNTVSVCPVCTPHRAALMTGRFPTSTGMFLNDLYLPDGELCFAEVLKGAGYATGYIGKWHLDGHGRRAYIPPERRQGWDYWKAAECDHNYLRSHYYTGTDTQKKVWNGYDVFDQTRDAARFVRERAKGENPFALLVAYGGPHFPHETAPAEYQALYPPESLKLPPNVPASMQSVARRQLQGYYAHCTAIDKAVGDLLKVLDESGCAQDTIVVFTSDHGDMMGAHGIQPKIKQMPYDESARVPLLIRCPAGQFAAGKSLATPMTTPDITATLLALLGVAIPSSVEGEDVSDLVRTGVEQDRAALYMLPDPWHIGDMSEYRAIRTARHTYIRTLRHGVMLFDDSKDPHQMDNLAGKPEHTALRAELEQRLQAELDRIGDPFRPAAYYLKRWGLDIKPYTPAGYSDLVGQESVKTPVLSGMRK
jgi:arylsulfatase A-like enzyme